MSNRKKKHHPRCCNRPMRVVDRKHGRVVVVTLICDECGNRRRVY